MPSFPHPFWPVNDPREYAGDSNPSESNRVSAKSDDARVNVTTKAVTSRNLFNFIAKGLV
jgi:hypothetical protein